MSLDELLESRCVKFSSHHFKEDICIFALECSKNHLSVLCPTNYMKKTYTHSSLCYSWDFFLGGGSWQFSSNLLQSNLHLILTHLNLCRNDTKSLFEHSKILTPPRSTDTWYQFIHSITFALPCPQGWGPLPELSHCFSLYFLPQCFNISPYFFPSGTSVAQQLSSHPEYRWGKRCTGSWGATRFIFRSRTLCRSRKGCGTGRTKCKTNASILRCDRNSCAWT